jgi:hypothetical protein
MGQNREWKERTDRVRSTSESGRSECAAANRASGSTRGHRLQGKSKLAAKEATRFGQGLRSCTLWL